MKDKYILAIESSCDETSAAIVMNGTREIATVVLSQISIHEKFGGVVPEIASRNHVENITKVIDELLKKASFNIKDIDAFAVTYGPGLIGSLLIGLEAAKALAFVYDKPLIPVHHIAGHIYANSLEQPLKFPLIALVISGGHTELIYMKEHYSFETIGGTLDDAVGEAYDKVARVLNMTYPGGPKVDQAAVIGEDTYNLPIPLDDETFNFSFSGLKSAVINLTNKEKMKKIPIRVNDLASSFQNRVISVLSKKTLAALKKYHVNNLIIAGGVAANKGIREKFEQMCLDENINLTIPNLKFCTDNATMIGAAAYFVPKTNYSDVIKAKAVDKLGG